MAASVRDDCTGDVIMLDMMAEMTENFMLTAVECNMCKTAQVITIIEEV